MVKSTGQKASNLCYFEKLSNTKFKLKVRGDKLQSKAYAGFLIKLTDQFGTPIQDTSVASQYAVQTISIDSTGPFDDPTAFMREFSNPNTHGRTSLLFVGAGINSFPSVFRPFQDENTGTDNNTMLEIEFRRNQAPDELLVDSEFVINGELVPGVENNSFINGELARPNAVGFHHTGDIDSDGIISMVDYQTAILAHQEIISLSSKQIQMGDVVEDGDINDGDLEVIKNAILGNEVVEGTDPEIENDPTEQ